MFDILSQFQPKYEFTTFLTVAADVFKIRYRLEYGYTIFPMIYLF